MTADRGFGQVSLFGEDTGAARPRLPGGRALDAHPAAGRGAGGRRLLPQRPPAGAAGRGPAPQAHHPLGRGGAAGRAGRTRPSAWRAWCAASQERPSKSGEKFAFVTLSDPTGEFEVLFPPETCASAATCWSPARPAGQGALQGPRGRAALLRRRRRDAGHGGGRRDLGLRVYMTPERAAVEALKRAAADGAARTAGARSAWWRRWRAAARSS